MHLKYELTLKDYYAFNRYSLWLQPSKKKRRRLLLFNLIVPTLLILLLWFSKEYTSPAAIICYCLLALAVYMRIMYTTPFLNWWARYYLKKDPNRFSSGPRELELSKECLTVTGKGARSTVEWSLPRQIAETKEAYYLYYTLTQAIIIPKRIFQNERQQYETITFIRQQLEQNKAPYGQSTIPEK